MSYNLRVKNRKLKNKIKKFLNLISFKSSNSSYAQRVLIIWLIVSSISLFYPWISFVKLNETININSFNSISWNIGYFVLLLNLFIFFIIISQEKKEFMKFYLWFWFKDHYIISIYAFIYLFIHIFVYNVISWLSIFTQDLILWFWFLLSLSSNILIIISTYFIYKNYKSDKITLCINDSDTDDKDLYIKSDISDDKNNMKLPF